MPAVPPARIAARRRSAAAPFRTATAPRTRLHRRPATPGFRQVQAVAVRLEPVVEPGAAAAELAAAVAPAAQPVPARAAAVGLAAGLQRSRATPAWAISTSATAATRM